MKTKYTKIAKMAMMTMMAGGMMFIGQSPWRHWHSRRYTWTQ